MRSSRRCSSSEQGGKRWGETDRLAHRGTPWAGRVSRAVQGRKSQRHRLGPVEERNRHRGLQARRHADDGRAADHHRFGAPTPKPLRSLGDRPVLRFGRDVVRGRGDLDRLEAHGGGAVAEDKGLVERAADLAEDDDADAGPDALGRAQGRRGDADHRHVKNRAQRGQGGVEGDRQDDRVVARRMFRDEIEREVIEAKREARAAFGKDEVYLEKLVENARHVESQVLGDTHGNAVHLFERDCSIQRRNQKVVKRAPAPYLSAEQRAELAEYSLRIANATSYIGAGTVEYLMDADTGKFYFIEVNPRIQVEHTVTEEVTGIDIVKAQIHILEGAEIGTPESGVPK